MSFLQQFQEVVTDIGKTLNLFIPVTTQSTNWRYWSTAFDGKACRQCTDLYGKIYPAHGRSSPTPPLHPNCRCAIIPLQAVNAGSASYEGENGADWWLKNYKILPLYYLSKEDYYLLGWQAGKKPAAYAPGKMMTGGIYRNIDGHLPYAPGRIWYEADINYYQGKRNGHRILWSSDGLIFVTYDHYTTFLEIK